MEAIKTRYNLCVEIMKGADTMYENESENQYTESYSTVESPGDRFTEHRNERKIKSPSYVTVKAFVITLIICMVATCVGTFFLTQYFGRANAVPQKKVSATNYGLNKPSGKALSVQQVIADNENAVVEIRTESVSKDSWLKNYVTEGAGSGVIVDSKGYILTCNHVIEGASNITVTLKNGKKYTASLVGADPATDVAVIRINGKNFPAATYGDCKSLALGDRVVAIGNPLGQLGGSASCGIISSLDRELEIGGRTMSLLQTDASINPGNSGGGLFDSYGNLIGIVVAKSTGSDIEGLGFAIPVNKASEIAKSLIENGKVKDRCLLGISILEIPDAKAAMEQGVEMAGVYVHDIKGRNAKKAGFQPGDYIYYLDGEKITQTSQIFSILEKHKPGDKIPVTVIRGNKTIKLETVLDEAQ